MQLTLEQRAFRNNFVGYLSFILVILGNLLTVPILLTNWGSETYGIWLALLSGVIILKSFDSGHINFIGNEINLLYHRDKEKLREVLGSSILISIILGIIQFLICIVLIFFNQLDSLLGLSGNQVLTFNINNAFLILLLVWLVIGSFGGILHRLFIPTGLLFQSQWWGILQRTTEFLSIIIIVFLGGTIIQVVIGYSIIQSIVFISSFIYLKQKVPEFYPWWKIINIKVGFTNFKKSIILSINSFIQQISVNGLVLFVASFFSPSIVPAFTTVRTLTNTAGSITNVSVNALLPEIVRFHANSEDNKLKNTIYTNWLISGAIVNIGIILILPFIENFYFMWTKGHLSFDFNLFLLLVSSISLMNFGSGLLLYLTGINNIKAQTVITFVRVFIIFILSFTTYDILGLSGIGVGILVSEIVSSAILPIIFVNRELVNFGTSLENKFIFLAALSPLVILSTSIIIILSITNTLLLVTIAFILFIIIYVHYWKILSEDVKIRLKDLASSLLSKLFFK